MKRKIIHIVIIMLFVIIIVILFLLIGFYIDAKYRKRKATSETLMKKEIELTDNELIIHAEMYPGLRFYQGYEYTIVDDNVYITIYWTMIAQNAENSCSFTEHIYGDFKDIVRIYLQSDETTEIIYEKEH